MPRRRKRRKWGSIRSESRYKHIIRWVENTPNGRVRRCYTFHGSEAEAQLWLDRKHVELADAGDKPVPTVGDAYRMWWRPWAESRTESGSMAESTLKEYERKWEAFAEGRWGSVPLDSIRPLDVQEWLDGLTKGNAETTMKVLKKVVDFAVKYEVVDSNKFRIGYDLPQAARKRDASVLALAQAESLFRDMKGAVSEPAFIAACFGGARTGEALGLSSSLSVVTARGVSFACADVERTVGSANGEVSERLKTRSSRRKILVPFPYGERLLEIAEGREEWLCDFGDGTPMGKAFLGRMWRREGGPVPFSNLRNSWRTFAEFEWGVGHETLEILMGHALPGVTGRHYLRPDVQALAESFAEAYSSHLGKVR